MKNKKWWSFASAKLQAKSPRLLAIIAIAAMIGIGFTACDDGGSNTGGNTNTNQTPVADDYNIDNLFQKLITGNVAAVTITTKSGKSPGTISNIRYAGNTAVPQTRGTYAVYFSVAAATGWNAAPDIFAGNLIIVDYYIGDIGPGGGKIIYASASASGFNVAGLGTCHYLEAAPTNQATSIAWSLTNGYITGATGTAIGTGKANTAAIIADPQYYATAARTAAAYTGGGKNDWFLPSKDELNEMYKARTHLGISSGSFWSSSQSSANNAWFQNFDDGYQGGDYPKGYLNNVRAIRAF